MNRIDPDLFSDCFMSWASDLCPDAGLIALDGKTSRRSHDRGAGKAALHLAPPPSPPMQKLVLGQEAVHVNRTRSSPFQRSSTASPHQALWRVRS